MNRSFNLPLLSLNIIRSEIRLSSNNVRHFQMCPLFRSKSEFLQIASRIRKKWIRKMSREKRIARLLAITEADDSGKIGQTEGPLSSR